ncbi:cyclase [Nitrospira sp.]|nr:cyclase [Nitrospira sp.]
MSATLQTVGWAQVDERRLLDLTYAFDEHTLAWPGNEPFRWERAAWGRSESGNWYAAGNFRMAEHSGTHLDAPIHFAEDRQTLDAIPLHRLIGPAVVMSVADQVSADADYRLSVKELLRWEGQHGRIPTGAIVLLHTGWGARWPDRKRYFGSETPDDATTLHFPGYSREAAEWLVRERQIRGVGIDTASIDYGPSQDFPVHRVLNTANVYGLENIANLDRVPATGATLIAMPMKIAGGTGGPVRIVVVLPDGAGRSLP